MTVIDSCKSHQSQLGHEFVPSSTLELPAQISLWNLTNHNVVTLNPTDWHWCRGTLDDGRLHSYPFWMCNDWEEECDCQSSFGFGQANSLSQHKRIDHKQESQHVLATLQTCRVIWPNKKHNASTWSVDDTHRDWIDDATSVVWSFYFRKAVIARCLLPTAMNDGLNNRQRKQFHKARTQASTIKASSQFPFKLHFLQEVCCKARLVFQIFQQEQQQPTMEDHPEHNNNNSNNSSNYYLQRDDEFAITANHQQLQQQPQEQQQQQMKRQEPLLIDDDNAGASENNDINRRDTWQKRWIRSWLPPSDNQAKRNVHYLACFSTFCCFVLAMLALFSLGMAYSILWDDTTELASPNLRRYVSIYYIMVTIIFVCNYGMWKTYAKIRNPNEENYPYGAYSNDPYFYGTIVVSLPSLVIFFWICLTGYGISCHYHAGATTCTMSKGGKDLSY